MNILLEWTVQGNRLAAIGLQNSREVPVVEMTIQALVILALICIFLGFYAGIRVARPRYWD